MIGWVDRTTKRYAKNKHGVLPLDEWCVVEVEMGVFLWVDETVAVVVYVDVVAVAAM